MKEHHAGTFGECPCFPGTPDRRNPDRAAARADVERYDTAWRRHWGWIEGKRNGTPAPSHTAPAYRAGWEAATA